MKSEIKSGKRTVYSDYTFMNSIDHGDTVSISFAEKYSDDSILFKMNKTEAEKLRNHLEWFLNNGK